jgi:Ca-activated chloride channel family protein
MNTTHEQTWKLDELARQAGVSARTVRYYVQRGLLHAPVFRGRDTVYSNEHLLRLRAIRRLQEQFLPLDAIQRELERCSPAELHTLAAGPDEAGSTTAGPSVRRQLIPTSLLQRPTSIHDASERWQRWELAPGLELHLSERADVETRRYADELLSAVTRRHTKGGFK